MTHATPLYAPVGNSLLQNAEPRKRLPLILSAIVHGGAVLAFISVALWRIEKLPVERVSEILLQRGNPLADGGGTPAAAPLAHAAVQKHVVHDMRQPDKPKVDDVHADVTVSTDAVGTGGTGTSGTGIGSVAGPPCATPPCDLDAIAPPVVPMIDTVTPPAPTLVPPSVVEGLRISGNAQIQPSADVTNAMQRDGKSKVHGSFKLCLGASGEVTSVSTISATGYAAYDDALRAGIADWRYRPYEIGGQAVPVCGMVTFVFQLQ